MDHREKDIVVIPELPEQLSEKLAMVQGQIREMRPEDLPIVKVLVDVEIEYRVLHPEAPHLGQRETDDGPNLK